MSSLTVNGRAVDLRMDPQTPLLWALRDAMNLTGTKYGCGSGDCGACMVLVDGEAQVACQISLANAEGRQITTIEGLSHNRSHAVQQAFASAQAVQCGFCTPGMVIAAAGLLAHNPAPTADEIKAAVPNLCRCGVYPRLVAAIQRAGRALQGQEAISAATSAGEAAHSVPALAPSPQEHP